MGDDEGLKAGGDLIHREARGTGHEVGFVVACDGVVGKVEHLLHFFAVKKRRTLADIEDERNLADGKFPRALLHGLFAVRADDCEFNLAVFRERRFMASEHCARVKGRDLCARDVGGRKALGREGVV